MSVETTILKAEINKLVLVTPAICSAIIFIIGVMAAGGGGALVGLIIATLWLGTKYLGVTHTYISLSNTRITGKTGVINTKSMDSPLNKVNNISAARYSITALLLYRPLRATTISSISKMPMLSRAGFWNRSKYVKTKG